MYFLPVFFPKSQSYDISKNIIVQLQWWSYRDINFDFQGTTPSDSDIRLWECRNEKKAKLTWDKPHINLYNWDSLVCCFLQAMCDQEGWVTGCGHKDNQTGRRQQEKEMVMVQGDWGTEAHPHGLGWKMSFMSLKNYTAAHTSSH